MVKGELLNVALAHHPVLEANDYLQALVYSTWLQFESTPP